MRRTALAVIEALVLLGVPTAVAGGATRAETGWAITDLGTLGGNWSEAVAINQNAVIVGSSDIGGSSGIDHAFLWRDATMRDLGAPGGKWESEAVGINERGQVVGNAYSWRLDYRWRAVTWQYGHVRYVGTLGGRDSVATAVNDRGQVVGRADQSTKEFGEDHAFLWDDGRMIDLAEALTADSAAYAINARGEVLVGTGGNYYLWRPDRLLRIGLEPTAHARVQHQQGLNDHGWVVGSVRIGRRQRAAVWERGRIHVLPSLSEAGTCTAVDINDRGVVAGTCTQGGSDTRARPCIWVGGNVLPLRMAFGDRGNVVAINDRRQIIGYSRAGGGPIHAFLWQSGMATDLGVLGRGGASMAVDINERGQIVGWSDTKRGRHAVLWTPKRG